MTLARIPYEKFKNVNVTAKHGQISNRVSWRDRSLCRLFEYTIMYVEQPHPSHVWHYGEQNSIPLQTSTLKIIAARLTRLVSSPWLIFAILRIKDTSCIFLGYTTYSYECLCGAGSGTFGTWHAVHASCRNYFGLLECSMVKIYTHRQLICML